MTIQKYSGDEVVGVSTDTKPTNMKDGARFFETDTKKIYLLISGSWTDITDGLTTTKTFYAASSSGGGTTVLNTVTLRNGLIITWTQE